MLDVYLNLARPETSYGSRSIERVSSLTAVSAIGHHGSAHHVDGESVVRFPCLGVFCGFSLSVLVRLLRCFVGLASWLKSGLIFVFALVGVRLKMANCRENCKKNIEQVK